FQRAPLRPGRHFLPQPFQGFLPPIRLGRLTDSFGNLRSWRLDEEVPGRIGGAEGRDDDQQQGEHIAAHGHGSRPPRKREGTWQAEWNRSLMMCPTKVYRKSRAEAGGEERTGWENRFNLLAGWVLGMGPIARPPQDRARRVVILTKAGRVAAELPNVYRAR